MIVKLIGIASWAIEKYENVKAFIKKKYRQHRSRKIRNAIDARNTRAVKHIVSDIIKKRQAKRDSV